MSIYYASINDDSNYEADTHNAYQKKDKTILLFIEEQIINFLLKMCQSIIKTFFDFATTVRQHENLMKAVGFKN